MILDEQCMLHMSLFNKQANSLLNKTQIRQLKSKLLWFINQANEQLQPGDITNIVHQPSKTLGDTTIKINTANTHFTRGHHHGC